MIDFIVQFFSVALLMIGLYLMGNNRKLGPAVLIFAELFVIAVGIMHVTWSIVLIGIGLTVMNVRNLIKWHKEGVRW